MFSFCSYGGADPWRGLEARLARAGALPVGRGPDTHSRHKRMAIECDTTAWLDMAPLVWTRGAKFPLDQLHGRLKCPNCGERRVR
jgi:hypothetical protein